jgi:hypothetical protein
MRQAKLDNNKLPLSGNNKIENRCQMGLWKQSSENVDRLFTILQSIVNYLLMLNNFKEGLYAEK